MSDLFERTQAEFNRGQADFLMTELATCSRCVYLAATTSKAGNSGFADRQIVDAENAYATARKLLADSNFCRHLTIKALQEARRSMQELRTRLDQLSRPP